VILTCADLWGADRRRRPVWVPTAAADLWICRPVPNYGSLTAVSPTDGYVDASI
jgi:hypothetical protein